MRTLAWTRTTTAVPAFDGECRIGIAVECSLDFNAATTKYFAAVDDGEVPLTLQFSGTVFYSDDDGCLQIGRIPWTTDARCALPIATWRSMMDAPHPGTAWLCLQRDAVDRLGATSVSSAAILSNRRSTGCSTVPLRLRRSGSAHDHRRRQRRRRGRRHR